MRPTWTTKHSVFLLPCFYLCHLPRRGPCSKDLDTGLMYCGYWSAALRIRSKSKFRSFAHILDHHDTKGLWSKYICNISCIKYINHRNIQYKAGVPIPNCKESIKWHAFQVIMWSSCGIFWQKHMLDWKNCLLPHSASVNVLTATMTTLECLALLHNQNPRRKSQGLCPHEWRRRYIGLTHKHTHTKPWLKSIYKLWRDTSYKSFKFLVPDVLPFF